MFLTNRNTVSGSNASPVSASIFNFGILALLSLFHFFMVLNFEINWDEFFRLARVYQWKSGTLSAIFESNYIHGFRWLEYIHENEIYQIIAARCVMFVLLIYISFISFLILKHFFDSMTALITLIGFLSFSFVFRHATSFRIDLPIISLLMTVIWLTAIPERKRYHFLIAGLCLGLAGSISIKSIFYVPTIALILLIHWWQSGWKIDRFINGLIVGLSSIVFFFVIIYWHSQTLVKAESAYGFISYASNAAIVGYGLFPQKETLLASIGQNPIYWILLILGFGLASYDLIKGHNRLRAFICLSCLLPFISLAIYVHTYIYFYTYLLAAASLPMAYGVSWLIKSYRSASFVIPVALMITTAPVFIKSFYQTKEYQVQVNNVIHTMFPTPVNYIDRTSQISSFPKQGLFMTAVQMGEYEARGLPVMSSVFETTPPEFVLANIDSLKLDTVREQEPLRRLMKADEDLLVENFIHHWGPIYVPGKQINGHPAPQKIDIKLAGIYTVESKADVIINGTKYQPMASLHLDKGSLTISTKANENIRLRWGKDLYKPDFKPLDTIIFHGF